MALRLALSWASPVTAIRCGGSARTGRTHAQIGEVMVCQRTTIVVQVA